MNRIFIMLMWMSLGLCMGLPAVGSRWAGAVPQESSEGKKSLVVIVNRANPVESLSLTELRKIFRAERNHWSDGRRITIVLEEPGQPERTTVLREIYRMSERDFNRYFLQATFTGEALSAPKTLTTSSGVRKFIFYAPSAIGCVRAEDVDESVKVIRVDGYLPGEKGYPLRLEQLEAR